MPNMNNIDPKKWLVTFGKSIAYTTRDIVVDKLPNATSILSEVGNSVTEAKDSVENAIRGKVPDIGSLDMNSIKNSSEYRNAMKAIDGVIADIKSGNIAHAAELVRTVMRAGLQITALTSSDIRRTRGSYRREFLYHCLCHF